MPATPPPVTGLMARFFGAPGGSQARSYWVQALYPDGSRSLFAGPVTLSNTTAALGGGSTPQSGVQNVGTGNFVAIQWNPAPGAIAYDVICTATNTYPTGQSNIGVALGITQNAIADVSPGAPGTAAYLLYTPMNRTYLNVGFMRYDFLVDGGAIGAITPASFNDVIPANAIIVGGTLNTTVAVTSAGAATIAVGTTAGSSATSLLAATGKASFVVATPINLAATFAAPVKMTALGQFNITVAAAALTAGSFEVYVLYVVPTL